MKKKINKKKKRKKERKRDSTDWKRKGNDSRTRSQRSSFSGSDNTIMPDTRRCYLSERHSSRTSARNEAKHDINNAEYLSWLDFFRKSEEGYSYSSVSISDPSGNALLSTLFPFARPCRQDSPSRIKRAAILSPPYLSSFFLFFSFLLLFRSVLHLVAY